MRRFLATILFVALAATLALASDATAALKKADSDWSKSAESKNLDQFVSFVDDNIAQCGLDGKWVHGKAGVRNAWSKDLADPNFKVSWTLESAEVSKDGGFGYTRGTFQGSNGGKPFSGSYATFWKKGKDGKWRAVVDIASPAAQQ